MVEVMNMATGVAQIKGKYYVGQDEIDPASTIKNEGTTKFLPEVLFPLRRSDVRNTGVCRVLDVP